MKHQNFHVIFESLFHSLFPSQFLIGHISVLHNSRGRGNAAGAELMYIVAVIFPGELLRSFAVLDSCRSPKLVTSRCCHSCHSALSDGRVLRRGPISQHPRLSIRWTRPGLSYTLLSCVEGESAGGVSQWRGRRGGGEGFNFLKCGVAFFFFPPEVKRGGASRCSERWWWWWGGWWGWGVGGGEFVPPLTFHSPPLPFLHFYYFDVAST